MKTWRGFTFTDEQEEYTFLNALVLNTGVVSLEERNRWLFLNKKLKVVPKK